MADTARATRRAIFEPELVPTYTNRSLHEITPDDLRARCPQIVDRGAAATVIPLRGVVKQI
ncbi:MAG: hypothetical protein KGL42_09440 [Betaproteobacteria bacterium]|nr:hypothetical protein [Betaproteobacteria bacterium]